LKTFGLVFEGGYLFSDVGAGNADETDITGTITAARKTPDAPPDEAPAAPAAATPEAKPAAKLSWAQEMFNFPDVTGSTPAAKPPPAAEAGGAKEAKAKPPPKNSPPGQGWTPSAAEPRGMPSAAERAILERLSERRGELEARSKELDMRENLVKAAEKRLEERIDDLKALEKRVNTAARIKDENDAARFKNVVTMYENMKAKDAAKIFDRLELKVLVDVSTKINPRRMADILAQMSPDSAERLTVELASRKDAKEKAPPELPKIEGHPTAN
jgi:flagellar motility protein MotE (MotC chaperone)